MSRVSTLQFAAWCGHLAVVNRLLEIPAVLAKADAHNNRALRRSAENGHIEIVRVILRAYV